MKKLHPPPRVKVSVVAVNGHKEFVLPHSMEGLDPTVDQNLFLTFVEEGTGRLVVQRKTPLNRKRLFREERLWAG